MNQTTRPDRNVVYRNPRLGLMVLTLALVWMLVVWMFGDLLASRLGTITQAVMLKTWAADRWNTGVTMAYFLWSLWIVRSIGDWRFRCLSLLLCVIAVCLLRQFSPRVFSATLTDVLGLFLASAALQRLLPIPHWHWRRRCTNQSIPTRTGHWKRRFDIVDLLIATTIAGLLFALARRMAIVGPQPMVYWAVASMIWLGLSLTATLAFRAALRRDAAGRMLLGMLTLSVAGIILSVAAVAEMPAAIAGVFLAGDSVRGLRPTAIFGYVFVFSGFLSTLGILGLATGVQSYRDAWELPK
ncbi:MAG: hypothetical protein AAF958_03790 [Planctomycetota bacterium]